MFIQNTLLRPIQQLVKYTTILNKMFPSSFYKFIGNKVKGTELIDVLRNTITSTSMYSSYFSSNGFPRHRSDFASNTKKSTSEYLFLNMVRVFSVIYLVLTIFYIPIYMAIGQLNLSYWQATQQKFSLHQKVLLHGTIFTIKKNENCYKMQPQYRKVGLNSTNQHTQDQLSNLTISYINNQEQCFRNRVTFLPFIQTVDELHGFYFSYYMAIHLLFFVGVVISQYLNKKLFIELEYPTCRNSNQQKLQMKKMFHIQCKSDLAIYFLKPLLMKNLQKQFEKNIKQKVQQIRIKNIKVSVNQKCKTYADINIKIASFKIRLSSMKNQWQQQQQGECKNQLTQIISRSIEQLHKLNLQKTQLEIQIEKDLLKNNRYHYQHLWIHMNTFQDCLNLNKFINSQKSEIKILKLFDSQLSVKFDRIQFSDLIVDNMKIKNNYQTIRFISTEKICKNQQEIQQFHPKRSYFILLKYLKISKILIGILFCLLLTILVDILILIIQKNNILSYSNVFIVLILQILLKAILTQISVFQRHQLYSHLALSTMLKLTLLIFFNLTLILLIGHHDLGQSNLGKIISSYQFDSVNQQWFLKVGTSIIIIVLIQIIYCNLRVYIQISKRILFTFLSQKITSLGKFSKIKDRFKYWMDDLRANYKKPVIDLQVCYSHILPIYLIGLIFCYLFPVLYPLLFVFSITIYQTHKNYIQLYTQKVPYNNSTLLNDWAYFLIYAGFMGGLILIGMVQDQRTYSIFIIVIVGIQIIIWIAKCLFIDLDKMILSRLEQLSSKERQLTIDSQQQFITQRRLNSQKPDQNNSNQAHHQKNISNQLIDCQIQQKRVELVLMQIFHSKSQNTNEVHAQFYQKYNDIINQELKFFQNLQRKLQYERLQYRINNAN